MDGWKVSHGERESALGSDEVKFAFPKEMGEATLQQKKRKNKKTNVLGLIQRGNSKKATRLRKKKKTMIQRKTHTHTIPTRRITNKYDMMALRVRRCLFLSFFFLFRAAPLHSTTSSRGSFLFLFRFFLSFFFRRLGFVDSLPSMSVIRRWVHQRGIVSGLRNS